MVINNNKIIKKDLISKIYQYIICEPNIKITWSHQKVKECQMWVTASVVNSQLTKHCIFLQKNLIEFN